MAWSVRETVLNVAVTVLGIAAILSIGERVHDHQQRAADPAVDGPVRVAQWQQFARDGHRIGPNNALVTITVFSDYQCPFCRAADGDLRTLQAALPGQIALIYRQFPLPFHSHAIEAAKAVMCADAQGSFETMHKVLFQHQDSLGIIPWQRLAADGQVRDIRAFSACSTQRDVGGALARDTVAGHALGISGTPTILINDEKFTGSPGKDTLQRYIESALRARS